MEEICTYYQAQVDRSRCWLFTALFRSFEHLAFDRTFDIQTSQFEFFVPIHNELLFLTIMNYLEQEELVKNLEKLPNRLAPDAAQLQ